LQKEQDKYVIALPGIKCVTEACIAKLEGFDRILEKQPVKVNYLIRVEFKLNVFVLLTFVSVFQIDSAEMSYGTLTPPLSFTRLNVIKLIAKLMQTNNEQLIDEIIRLGTLNKILVSARI
jgi:hypothetical protein